MYTRPSICPVHGNPSQVPVPVTSKHSKFIHTPFHFPCAWEPVAGSMQFQSQQSTATHTTKYTTQTYISIYTFIYTYIYIYINIHTCMYEQREKYQPTMYSRCQSTYAYILYTPIPFPLRLGTRRQYINVRTHYSINDESMIFRT